MAYAKSKAGKGSGWHKQPTRHSRARKYGKAGGRYAKRISYQTLSPSQAQKLIDESKGMTKAKFNKLWYIAHHQISEKAKIKKIKDSDGDGVPDKQDCQPHNPQEQGLFHKKPIKIKIRKKTIHKAKNQLEKDLLEAIKKTKDPRTKARLKHLYKELRKADTHTKIRRYMNDYGYALSTLGMGIPLALISPLITAGVIIATGLTGDVPMRAFLPRIAVPLSVTVIGTEATKHSIKTIRAINKAKKRIYKEKLQEIRKETDLPLKEAQKIASRITEEEISKKKIVHELI